MVEQKIPGMGVCGEVESAKGVALAGHVFPQKISRPVDLQVGLQIWLLLEILHLIGCLKDFFSVPSW